MEITLKLKIQDTDFDLKIDVTMKAGRIYRQQFERDMVKDMSEIYRMVNGSVYEDVDFSKIDAKGKTEEELYQEVMNQALLIYFAKQAETTLDYTHTEQASQIIWAFCKNADEKLPNYEDWIDSFDFILPVKDLITSLYEIWNESARPTIEIKN